ncbi:HEAT repeat [Chitinophaga sp. YR573]|uniref:HEAT repeat domain-containing protein n=1 Tax=Chitinophaga sp. YR573 TaxID=1881040 RepID=UPI0008C57329|nr:HEAT repeat domain-containing protein [Chitinophaga sp. YR573]SEV92895.1 HEAT repeat [Chitinophaga sp. YR573]
MKKILLIILTCTGLFAQAQTLPATTQQTLPATGLEAKILTLTAGLKPVGQGDNTSLQYTLSGYAHIVTDANKEEERKIVSRAFCKALPIVKDPENKAFIISLLQICGDNKSVPALKVYLNSKRLCDPATRALVQINSPDAKVALLAALKKAAVSNNQISLIAAIGEVHYLGALDEITAFTASKDPLIKRTALLALANIGDEDSEPILAAAAEKSHYNTDSTQAVAAYILYIKRLALNWPIGPAVAASEKLLKKSHSPYVRSAALELLVQTRSKDAIFILMSAVDDTVPQYRAAAFQLAGRNITGDNAEQWVRKAELSEGAVKAGVITMLGASKQTAGSRLIKNSLSDKDPRVKLAAINAVGALGTGEMVPALLNTMKTADTLSVTAIRDVLLTIRGLDVVSRIMASLPFQPPLAQTALKEVLAIRNPTNKTD